jgi:aconitate hydratase
MERLNALGATVLANACGPCIGQWRRSQTETEQPNTIVTSYNRNFPRRNDGQSTTMNFIASPEIVTALAIAGKLSFNPLTDSLTGADGKPFKLALPKPAPEVPSQPFASGHTAYLAPPADGVRVEIQVAPDSERLQVMTPWPAWDGRDFLDMPVLMKTRGKTTTDHISPAGPWLRFRGHLDKFSDNLLMGATNAFTHDTGTGTHVITGETGLPISSLARDYHAKGYKWVIVGDDNYGEGSSREHAALSPRLLGGAAVIARSFARIHESNLKKQGLLALTFRSPTDYDKICEDDRISLVGLAQMAPGQPVTCLISHADGTSETLALHHSYSDLQIEWFKRGSALNLLHP